MAAMRLFRREAPPVEDHDRLGRAAVFASAVYPACAVCQSEAVEVHTALEALAGRPLVDLDADCGIRDLLRPVIEGLPLSRQTSGMDSLDVVEFIMALEEERGEDLGREEIARALEDATCEGIVKRVLGQ